MGQWKDLPHEVVLLINTELPYRGSWKFVNKQLYTIYQSFKFASISFNFQDPTSDSKHNSVINSSFQPGKWVKSVSLYNFTAPQKVENSARMSALHLEKYTLALINVLWMIGVIFQQCSWNVIFGGWNLCLHLMMQDPSLQFTSTQRIVCEAL